MRTRIKVCCISSPAEAALAVRLGADALGLVGPMPSGPGTLDDDTIATIARGVPPPVAVFLLTSRTSAAGIVQHAAHTQPTAVQIVDHIEPAQSAELARTAPAHLRRVQVIHVESASALALIAAYESHVHAFLLDSGRPSLATPELGGTGRTHDWSVSAAFVRASPLPVFLAGGLTAGNVGEAIRTVRPFGVDVCTGVRTGGALDAGKLSAFVRAVREGDGE